MNDIKQVLKRFLLILMTVQILLGMMWILCNFFRAEQFSETERYVSAAAGGAIDEYMGVLYPVLIKTAQVLTSPFGGQYEIVLCLLQLIVAFIGCSGFVALAGCTTIAGDVTITDGRTKQSWFGGLFLMTIPLNVQWHLTILPNSLVASLFFLLLGIVIRAYHDPGFRNIRMICRVSILWALMILLMPDYLWFGAVPVVFGAVLVIRQSGKLVKGKQYLNSLGRIVVVLLLSAVLAGGINSLVQKPGSGGRIQKSLGASMVSRLVWPNFGTNYFFWPEEIKTIMTEAEGSEISQYADNVQLVFGPMVEAAYGQEEADRLYWNMALQCVKDRTKETLQAIGEDLKAYLCPPWVVKDQLDGAGLSYSGWNYGKMRSAAPALTKWYVNYGLYVFRVGIVIALAYGVLKRLYKKKGRKKRCGAIILSVSCIILQAVWYTMSGAGMMDYGNVCVITMLWYSIIWTVYHE